MTYSMNVLHQLNQLAESERAFRARTFLAPCLAGGGVRARMDGLVYQFRIDPSDFEGWGLFHPDSSRTAKVVGEAEIDRIEAYLNLFPHFRLLLVERLGRGTWLAYPVNESDMRQRVGSVQPLKIHLVRHMRPFDTVLAAWDGSQFWFVGEDRKADPLFAETLRQAERDGTRPSLIKGRGLTLEMMLAYQLRWVRQEAKRKPKNHARLRGALRSAGAELVDFHDRDNHWVVTWSTDLGDSFTSAVCKTDLTVLSAGICLDDRDRDFDLQSLVGVVERSPDWAR